MKGIKLSRREFMKTAGAGALAMSFPQYLMAATTPSNELRIGYPWDLKTLDPAFTTVGGDNAVAANIFDALIGYKPGTTDIIPEAATSWEIAKDNKSALFNLRKGIKWHKGYGEMTASDVKYHFERVIDPKTNGVYRGLYSIFKEVEVIDKYKLRVILNKPDMSFIYLLSSFRAGHIVCAKAIEELGKDYALNPIGSGPWVFDHWKARTEYVLTANEEYWGDKPRLKKVTFFPIPEQVSMFTALKRGDIDLMFIDDTQFYISAKNEPDLEAMRFPSLFMFHLTFNHTLKPVNDKKVRQAIAYGINRKEIIEHVLFNLVTPLKCVLADGYFGSTDAGVNQYDYNPEKAKALLSEAGYPNGFKIKAVFHTIQKAPEVYTVVQSNLAKIGIELELLQMEFAARNQFVKTEKFQNEYHMAWNAIGPRPPDGDFPLSNFYHSASFPPGLNHGRYEGIDELLEAERSENNLERRKNIFRKMMQKCSDDVMAIPLYSKDYMYTSRKNIQGVITGPGVGELELSLIKKS